MFDLNTCLSQPVRTVVGLKFATTQTSVVNISFHRDLSYNSESPSLSKEIEPRPRLLAKEKQQLKKTIIKTTIMSSHVEPYSPWEVAEDLQSFCRSHSSTVSVLPVPQENINPSNDKDTSSVQQWLQWLS